MQSTGSVISLRVTKSIDRTIRDASSVPIEERINYDCFSVIVCYCLFVYARLKNKFSRLVLFPSNGYTREKKKKEARKFCKPFFLHFYLRLLKTHTLFLIS